MNDEDFNYILKRVENNHPDRYKRIVKRYRDWLSQRDMTLESADSIDIEDYLLELDEKYANASSVKRVKSALTAFYKEWNKLRRNDRFDGDYERFTPPERADYSPDTTDTLKSRETKEDIQYLTPDEVIDVVEATDKLRDALIIRLLFQTGVRVSELINIRLADITESRNEIQIRGKGRKNRPVIYQDNLQLPLDIWREEYRPALYYAEDSPYLFPTSHSKQITRQTVSVIVREAADKAGHQERYGEDRESGPHYVVTPHTLRHSHAMAALNQGWEVYDISIALGHEDSETTANMYLHEDEDRYRRLARENGVSAY